MSLVRLGVAGPHFLVPLATHEAFGVRLAAAGRLVEAEIDPNYPKKSSNRVDDTGNRLERNGELERPVTWAGSARHPVAEHSEHH
jgi:hypothetical protein